MNDITRILHDLESGHPAAAEQLLPLVYAELRQLAARKMATEAVGQTLQPTALVHEAWLRLAGHDDRQWHGRTHFFAAAAEAMRRILIDNARRKRALRHGGGQQRLDAADLDLPSPHKEDQLLAVHDALDQLAAQEPKMAELVKLRFFVGLTNREAAEILAVSEPTVERWWAFARAWLFKAIQSP